MKTVVDSNGVKLFNVLDDDYIPADGQTVVDFIADATLTEEEIQAIDETKIQLFESYPELNGLNYKLLNLDNLPDIKRQETLANKGLKGEKKYFKGESLVWSSEKKYWFEPNPINPDGLVRIVKLFSKAGTVIDTWSVYQNLTDDDKQFFLKKQRELIFEYFKSQQAQLFQLLYAFFSKEINDYVMIGGTALADTLIDAKDNHESPVVRGTLAMEVPTLSGGTTTVLNGILAELV
jgi:hypothetical protein